MGYLPVRWFYYPLVRWLECMAQSQERQVVRQCDVQIDHRGRVTIPASVREQLGIDDSSADVRLTLEVLDKHEVR